MTLDLRTVLTSALEDHETGWSMGSFGALAEFHQDAGETARLDRPHELSRATRRGAIRLDGSAVRRCRAVAYEQLSKNRERWGQGLALCMSDDKAAMAQRSVITPLGSDCAAICAEDRGSLLFDMGLGLTQADFLVRTRDETLINVLEDNRGRSVFDPSNPAMASILKTHPHRVAVTPLGRIEVFQKIGGPDTGGVSPPGPHTHVLPKLMAAGKTHATNITVPSGLIPCAYMHPGNPLIDGLGHPRAYNSTLARQFDALYSAFAPQDLKAVKGSVARALESNASPHSFEEPATRAGRITLRVALRQLAQDTKRLEGPISERLIESWRMRFDGPADRIDDEPDEQAEHNKRTA